MALFQPEQSISNAPEIFVSNTIHRIKPSFWPRLVRWPFLIRKPIKAPETYPLNRTPLKIILAKNVDLARANMVTGHTDDGTATIVTAQDPEHPEYGNIQLKFTGNPIELRQWIINDDSGSRTTVVLGALSKGGNMPSRLFDIELNTKRPQR